MVTLIPGAFANLRDFLTERNGTVQNTYKTPHYIKEEETIRFLIKMAYPSQKGAINMLTMNY